MNEPLTSRNPYVKKLRAYESGFRNVFKICVENPVIFYEYTKKIDFFSYQDNDFRMFFLLC